MLEPSLLDVSGQLLDVVVTPTRRQRSSVADLYAPSAAGPFARGVRGAEVSIDQGPDGRLWAWEPVAARVTAGWTALLPGRETDSDTDGWTERLDTDRWEEASGWLAEEVAGRATGARTRAQDKAAVCAGQPPCAACSPWGSTRRCWPQAAKELTGLAETLRQPPPEPAWSQTAAGARYWIKRTGEQP